MLCSDSNAVNNGNEILTNFAFKMTQGVRVVSLKRWWAITQHESRNHV